MEERSRFSTANYIVPFLGLALMAYLGYMMVTSPWGLIYKILISLLFWGIVALQILFLALSMGKRDRNPGLNYEAMIKFNAIMLVIYAIGFVAYNVYFVIQIVNIFKIAKDVIWV